MNRQEVTLILTKAIAAYPNQAPNFQENPAIYELWCEMLSAVDAQLGLNNLNQHILNNPYFPTIADIAKQPEQDTSPYSDFKQRTQQHLLELNEIRSKAIKMPEHLRKQVEQLE